MVDQPLPPFTWTTHALRQSAARGIPSAWVHAALRGRPVSTNGVTRAYYRWQPWPDAPWVVVVVSPERRLILTIYRRKLKAGPIHPH